MERSELGKSDLAYVAGAPASEVDFKYRHNPPIAKLRHSLLTVSHTSTKLQAPSTTKTHLLPRCVEYSFTNLSSQIADTAVTLFPHPLIVRRIRRMSKLTASQSCTATLVDTIIISSANCRLAMFSTRPFRKRSASFATKETHTWRTKEEWRKDEGNLPTLRGSFS